MATLGALSPVLAFGTDNKLTGDFIDNISSTACNFRAYPDSKLPKLTKAPKGYEAFHLEHYGRHGSRWLVGPNDYIAPAKSSSRPMPTASSHREVKKYSMRFAT